MPTPDVAAIYRYGKPGATVLILEDRVELLTGMLWKRHHDVIQFDAIVSTSTDGLLGKTLRIDTAGHTFRTEVGVGVGEALRSILLNAMGEHRRRQSSFTLY